LSLNPVSPPERAYLRELAQRQREYAELPVMAERTRRWYAHNALHGDRPMVVMEIGSFINDLLPALRCQSELGQFIERQLLAHTVNHELVDDDKVVPGYFVVPWAIHCRRFDADIRRHHAADDKGRRIGFAVDHLVHDLERDLPSLKHSVFRVDRDVTATRCDAVAEIIGDLLPVRVENHALNWAGAPTAWAVELMGMETLLTTMALQPDLAQSLLEFLREDIVAFMQWNEREGLLTLNNANHYAGAGSYGFTDELPTSASARAGGQVLLTDRWLNANSQESVGISPAMFAELVYPVYENIARLGGLVYYGCCEPVHAVWDACLHRLPNLRKVSISAWCDEPFMGERLRGGRVVYSRKPSPNFIGVGDTFDVEGFTAHIANTLRAARGCPTEIIFRDIYTLCGQRDRAGRAVQIVRQQIEKLWS
jgi:hypothetical protein